MVDDQKDENEKELWKRATYDVSPIKRDGILENVSPELENTTKSRRKLHHTSPKDKNLKEHPRANLSQKNKISSSEIDARTSQKLARGQIPVEAILDLHGMNRLQAFDRVHSFILNSYESEKRCVLIITGKGKIDLGNNLDPDRPKPGIIKRELPLWIQEPEIAPYVLKLQSAHIKDGGEGASYIYLRRKRL